MVLLVYTVIFYITQPTCCSCIWSKWGHRYGNQMNCRKKVHPLHLNNHDLRHTAMIWGYSALTGTCQAKNITNNHENYIKPKEYRKRGCNNFLTYFAMIFIVWNFSTCFDRRTQVEGVANKMCKRLAGSKKGDRENT